MDKEVQELIAKFDKWRDLFKEQKIRGNPFCPFQPEITDIEQMMAVIERLSKGTEHGTDSGSTE